MFETIKDVNWSKLDQAHGKSDHIPEAINGLVSNDKDIRDASYWKLDNYIVLQSDLYEAAFHVIPFLIEILDSDIQHGRNNIYDLLFEIANGSAPDDIKCVYHGEETELTTACHSLILNHEKVYLDEISNVFSLSRMKALELLVSLTENTEKKISFLSDILNKENMKSELRTHIIKAISELDGTI